MVDEDYFEDFNRRRPRRQTYRGSYTNPGSSQFFDPSADILAGIESVEKSIGKRKTAVRDFENAATVRRQETLDSLRETEGMSDTGAVDSLRQQLMKDVDELYKLDISSFEGDRSAYLKKSGEVNKMVETIPALMGLIDAEGEAKNEAQSSSQDFYKKLLRSNNPDYYDFVDAASKGGAGISFRTQNGNIMAQLNGKDIFNGNAYVEAKKQPGGFDLVNYAGDYTPQINKADTLASKGLETLVSKEITQKVEKGIKLVGEEKTNYTLAREKYEERLRSGNIPIPVNESTYQMFGNYGKVNPETKELLEDSKDPWGKDLKTQEGATKEAVIKYMIEQRFPEDVVVNKTTNKPAMTVAQQRADQRANQKAKSGSSRTDLTQAARSQLNALGGVFDEVNSTVNKAFEMDQGGRVKSIAASINKNLPENANYTYLNFAQVKTQIEKERKKSVEAGSKEEVARLDELKNDYKLDQAPNKDLLYKKTFNKGKIQLDKPFNSSDKDKVLRTIARERGITSEEAFEVFKRRYLNNNEKAAGSTGAGKFNPK